MAPFAPKRVALFVRNNQEGYKVLLIDVDITGTNITAANKSTFWNEQINIIKYNDKDVNLFEIFQEKYMNGNIIPSMSIKKKDIANSYLINGELINVIGSEINVSSKLNYDPRIIFDELHSFWFIEFIKCICKSFSDSFSFEPNDAKIAIVLDNSPGFVGINPAIQEWLTDLGPIRGKFLTVASLDKQDLVSCSKAIIAIEQKFKSKLSGANKYATLLNNKPEKTVLTRESNNFFLRLASNDENDNDLNYYQPTTNRSLEKELNFYQSIIINKVPISIKVKSIQYNFIKSLNNQQDFEIIKKLLSIKDDENPRNFIYYDDYINNQFIEPYVSKNYNSISNRSLSVLKGNFTRIENLKTNFADRFNKTLKGNIALSPLIDTYQSILMKLLNRINETNFNEIFNLVERTWHPETQFNRIRQLFLSSIEKFSENNFEDDSFLATDENIPKQTYEDFHKKLKSGIIEKHNYNNKKFNSFSFSAYRTLISYLISPYLTKSANKKRSIKTQTLTIFTNIFHLQGKRFEFVKNNDKKAFTYQQFLVNEKNDITLSEWIEKYIYKSIDKNRLDIFINIKDFTKFYIEFCYTQARLIDLNDDFNFLVDVLKKTTTVSDNKSKNVIFPYIKGLLDNVIVNKSITHANIKDALKQSFASASEMVEFKIVLTDILKKWKMLK